MRCSRGRRLYSSRLSRCKIICGPYIVAAEERMTRNGPEQRIGRDRSAGAFRRALRQGRVDLRSARPLLGASLLAFLMGQSPALRLRESMSSATM
jgi:hypothetical protein